MPEQALDLWAPDIGTREIETPLSVLRRQASLLGQKTNNLLEGLVETTTEGTGFRQSFYIVAPALDRYKYLLFTIFHGIELYPVRYIDDHSTWQQLDSEQALVDWLRSVLSSDKTKHIINALIAQSRS